MTSDPATDGLELRGIDAGYGGMRIVEDVSLTVRRRSITVLTGPNGAGKSTLLATVLGTVAPTSGSVHLDGVDLGDLRSVDRLRAGVGWVPEGRALFPTLTVRENLRVAARAWKVPPRQVAARIDAVADRFATVAEKLDQPIRTLSGGQQQAVAVGRAFLAEPMLLLLDEPSTGLSTRAWRDVLDACRTAASQGTAVLIVEQRLLDTIAAVDRVAILVRGRIVREDRADDPALSDVVRNDYFSVADGG